MKKFILGLFFSLAFSSQAAALSCNDPSGFIKSKGAFTTGEIAAFGPDCQTISRYGVTPFSVVGIQIFTSAGTYTPTFGMLYAVAECVGNGGGGGGVASLAGNVGFGSGGGGGSYSRKLLTAAQIGVSQPVTFGATGTGGAAGNNSGTAGGDVALGTLCIGKGGGGGGGSSGTGFPGNGAGGVAGTGDFSVPGNPGTPGHGYGTATATTVGGGGGNAGFGFGSGGIQSHAADAGQNGGNYGGGGSGAGQANGNGAKAGGNGATGILVITEYGQ